MTDKFKELKPFRFWCQTVLPAVYDDSLSYYELLTKVVAKLNETITLANEIGKVVDTGLQTLYEQFQELKDYVDNFIDTLDVEATVEEKLNELIAEGALNPIIQGYIPSAISAWMAEYFDPTTEIPLDSSLSVQGAAADAKAVGDKGMIFHGIVSGTSLANFRAVGFYQLPSSSSEIYNNLEDKPTDAFNGGYMIVNHVGGGSAITQEVFEAASNRFRRYVRTISGSTVNNWTAFDGGITGMGNNGSVTGTRLSDNVVLGFYRVSSASYANMTDKPAPNFSGGYMCVYPAGTTAVFQVLVDCVPTYPIFYFRVIASTIEDWRTYDTQDNVVFNGVVSGTSFADNYRIGLYKIPSSSSTVYQNMSDKPVDPFNGGFLFNTYIGSGDTILQCVVSVETAGLTMYRRTLSSGNASSWIETSTGRQSVNYIGQVSGSAFSDNTRSGFFAVSSANGRAMEDTPSSRFGGGWLFNIPAGSSAIQQYLFDVVSTPNVRYTRTITQSSTGEWISAYEHTGDDINWCVLGDSISYGVYSLPDGTTQVSTTSSYVGRLSKILGCKYPTNYAVRGIGYIDSGNNNEDFFTDVLQAHDFSQFNLITVLLGINDYSASHILGDENSIADNSTISGGIRYTIQYLCEHAPKAKIIIITPFNASFHGTKESNWSIGTVARPNNGTLQQITDLIIHWCDYYGVEYINMTNYSVINRENIQSLLYDNLHPSAECHAMLARELSKKINWC